MIIQTGDSFGKDAKTIDSKRVRFMADDGRCLFEVTCCDDGHSIEVRAVDCCKVGGELFNARLILIPKVSNVVVVDLVKWDS